ncbi:ABC transporter permease [Chelatococcus asaccharovorans]|uniref:ABC transporter permease n=1 Tax=Chelatococcus asaccharovorans TaxID=28210 RepID=UPI00224C7A31|nr:ABC transporter permease [Chelatococcus asaccharovorans]CAH1658903.1 Peptide/nickel transport system permease protein [Chelatococcus asaccharovorans]CAH1688306.1 Peptide/nickel transport system permease protein [Chelatococcus asaccharovorans]
MLAYLKRFLALPTAALGLVALVLLALAAIFAPQLANQNPYDLATIDILSSRLPPGTASVDGYIHWLGTDDQGRDLLSAVLYGLRVSLTVALVATSIALVIGVVAALFASYFGGKVDAILMRLVDLQLAFPSILTALVLVALLGTGLDKVIIAITLSQWAYFARTLRSAAMVERTKEYIDAARTLKFSSSRIMFRHLLPNSVAPLAVVIVVEIASAISLEATLSFLGVGLPITEPSLGLLISNGYSYMLAQQYWLSVYPGLVLLLLLLSVNLIGERMRQMNNPWG